MTKEERDERTLKRAAKILKGRMVTRTLLSCVNDTKSYLAFKLSSLEHEVFMVLFLDNRHRLIEAEELFRGTIDGCSVHPREVVKKALRHNAAAVIFAHNHPSGVAEASHADELITKRLKEALGLVDIRVLDHIIISNGASLSFADRGLM